MDILVALVGLQDLNLKKKKSKISRQYCLKEIAAGFSVFLS